MMVLDCSAAVHIARRTELGESFSWLMGLDPECSIAPELFLAEVGNAFWKYAKAGACGAIEMRSYIRKAAALVDELVPMDELFVEASSEALRLDHSVYDMLYFVLARRNGATLVTADKGLNSLCEREGVACFHEFRRTDDGVWKLRE